MNKFLTACLVALGLLLASSAHADWWRFWEPAPAQMAQVTQAYLELRSGPADVYPVIHSLEKGEWLTLLRRKTNWMEVRDDKGREGWVHVDDILLTRDATGDTVAISSPKFDDYTTRRWESGLMMGEYDSEAVNAAYVGYWMTENLSAELWGSQVLGNTGELRLLALNLTHQPFPSWRYSPYFTVGMGQAFIKPKATLLQPENTREGFANVGIGMRLYVSDRFFVRAEVKDYTVFTEELNEEATEWKIGLSVFF